MSIIREPVRCEDSGFFGPDSISWRASGPTIAPALIYTAVMFFVSPQNASIGIENTGGFENPLDRIVRTAEYMYAIYFGDQATARHAAAVVNAVHDHVQGTWSPTGDRVHSASEPHNLLWLLIPFGQGMLDAYDAYGPRRLSREERDRFWREENTIVGELNRIPLDLLPKSQADVDDYFNDERPKLALTEPALRILDPFFPSLLYGGGVIPAPAALPMRVAVSSGVALLPDYVLRLVGERPYPPILKQAIIAAHRPFYASLAATPVLRDSFAMSVSAPCRAMVRRARAAARTGRYDAPPIQPDTEKLLSRASA